MQPDGFATEGTFMPANYASHLSPARVRARLAASPVRARRVPGTLTGILQQRASRNPSGVPMVLPGLDGHPDTHVTYAEIERRALAVAAYLERSTDINPGERVLVAGLAGPDYLAGMLGTMHARCIAVPAPPPLLPQLTQRCSVITQDCEPAGVLITGGLQGLVADGLDTLRSIRENLHIAYISALPDAPDGWTPSSPPEPGDIAYIQYTSGTTGDPQGAVFTHEAACAGTTMTAAHIRLTPGTSSASMLPPWHDLGLGALWLAMHGRSPCLITQPHDWIADPVGWLADLSRREVEITPVPSFAFAAITARLNRSTADQRARLSLRKLRLVLTGADPADPGAPQEFTDVLADCGLRENPARWLYGAAEAVGAVTGQPPDEPVREVIADPGYLAAGRIVPGTARAGIRLHTAGRPLRRTRVRARRLDGDGFCMAGEVGEVVMQGPQLATAYWRGTGSPWTTIQGERWMAIGDLGAVLDDGTLVLLGRLSDAIVVRERPVRRYYYPFLLEQAAARAGGKHIRSHRIVAFEDSDGRVVVAAEARAGANLAAAANAIRGALVQEFGIVAHVTFAAPGSIEVSTSGKTCRAKFAEAYRAGELAAETGQREAA